MCVYGLVHLVESSLRCPPPTLFPSLSLSPEHGAESDLRLAEAHVSAEQPVHGDLPPDHVVLDLHQTAELHAAHNKRTATYDKVTHPTRTRPKDNDMRDRYRRRTQAQCLLLKIDGTLCGCCCCCCFLTWSFVGWWSNPLQNSPISGPSGLHGSLSTLARLAYRSITFTACLVTLSCTCGACSAVQPVRLCGVSWHKSMCWWLLSYASTSSLCAFGGAKVCVGHSLACTRGVVQPVRLCVRFMGKLTKVDPMCLC